MNRALNEDRRGNNTHHMKEEGEEKEKTKKITKIIWEDTAKQGGKKPKPNGKAAFGTENEPGTKSGGQREKRDGGLHSWKLRETAAGLGIR